jgi:hypothetical protein
MPSKLLVRASFSLAFLALLGAANPAASQVPFEVIAKATGGDPAGTILVIRSTAELDELWHRMVERNPPPVVDFRRHMVVAYFLGTHSDLGISVDVDNVAIQGGEMTLGIRVVDFCGGGQFPVDRVVLISTVRWPGPIRADKRVEPGCGHPDLQLTE